MSVTNPYFSIIIPTYNRAEVLERALQSVADQSVEDFECLIVDDGSTDETQQVVQAWEDERFHYHQKKNEERGAARNFGIAKAKGKYITFLDSDDYLYPNALENARQHLQDYKHPPFYHQGYEVKAPDGSIIRQINHLPSDEIRIFVKGNPLSCLGVFVHHKVFEELQFNEDRQLSGSEDWELWVRIVARHGLKTSHEITGVLVEHQGRSSQNVDPTHLINRKTAAIRSILEDEVARQKLASYTRQLWAYGFSYIALHLVLGHYKTTGLRYWGKSVKGHVPLLWSSRSAAILKHLLFG